MEPSFSFAAIGLPSGNDLGVIMNYEREISVVLNSKTDQSDMGNVMEILGYSQSDFQKGFDIALEMQNRNLVKLLYSNFNANKVIVEFTRLARLNQK